jgi:hypothetical protein
MLIRSQDDKILTNTDNIITLEISKSNGIFAVLARYDNNYSILGEYLTEHEAIKSLNMILENKRM